MAPEKDQAASGEQRYELEDLREDSFGLFGVGYPVVVGALSGSSKKTFTREEVERAVERHLKHEEEVDRAERAA